MFFRISLIQQINDSQVPFKTGRIQICSIQTDTRFNFTDELPSGKVIIFDFAVIFFLGPPSSFMWPLVEITKICIVSQTADLMKAKSDKTINKAGFTVKSISRNPSVAI